MIITNSLGSNYSGEDIWLSLSLLFQPWRWKNGPQTEQLEDAIRKTCGDGRIASFQKGRQAIGEALRILKIGTGDEVIVQAFTCVAVVQPILEAGARPVYVDVAPRSLNPTLSSIKQRVTGQTKAVILQHTLGVVNPETRKIVDWCNDQKIFVIQDLAHAFGAPGFKNVFKDSPPGRVPEGESLRILSLSQDKVIDGVSGGSLIISNQSTVATLRLNDSNHLTLAEIGRTLLYPACAWLIRSTYQFGTGGFSIGKGIHWLAKAIGLMNSPVEGNCIPVRMPNAPAALALNQLNKLDKISNHRRQIALLYNEVLSSKLKIVSKNEILEGANLRYPIWVNNRDELEEKLKKYGYCLVDHWYGAPVSPERIDSEEVKYLPRSCPNAEELSKHIFNLPTHVNISRSKAEELAVLINKYAESQ